LATVRALDLVPGAEVVLAGRDEASLRRAAASLPADLRVNVEIFDALQPQTATEVVRRAFAGGDVDVVIPAFGLLGDQEAFELNPGSVADLLMVNVVAQSQVVMETARLMREQGHGTLVVLSSIAAVRARRANYVYGASKAAIDALAAGVTDALHGSGVDVLTVRPGFVIGRMTRGMAPAPLATTPDRVGAMIGQAVRARQSEIWVPGRLRLVAGAFRFMPRNVWRRLPR
jgi:decaprenylphospho-beta-D-erythro-pentofuranosid-2-ulose 2-reductase